MRKFVAGAWPPHAASGFAVVGDGIGTLSPLTAAFLGFAGSLSGRRAATDDQINIVIQTTEGLIGPRPLQLQWQDQRDPGRGGRSFAITAAAHAAAHIHALREEPARISIIPLAIGTKIASNPVEHDGG